MATMMDKKKVLIVEVTDASCTEGEAYFFEVPAETHWGVLQEAIELLHPTTTGVYIHIKDK